jgi:hypothetical protein
MTANQIIALIEADGLWVHPSGRGGWNASPSNSQCQAWNCPTLRAAVEAYAKLKAALLPTDGAHPDVSPTIDGGQRREIEESEE